MKVNSFIYKRKAILTHGKEHRFRLIPIFPMKDKGEIVEYIEIDELDPYYYVPLEYYDEIENEKVDIGISKHNGEYILIIDTPIFYASLTIDEQDIKNLIKEAAWYL